MHNIGYNLRNFPIIPAINDKINFTNFSKLNYIVLKIS